MRKVYSSLILLLILVFTGACNSGGQKKGGKEAAQKVPDLEEILTAGKIRVVTNYNSTNYFVYKGQPMGYQFELLQEFATFIGVKLEVTVNNDLQTNFEALQNGLIDIIASNLPVMRESEDYIAYTAPHSFSRQVLVQQAYSSDQKGSNNIQYNTLIRNQLDLAGKSIYVQKGSAYVQRLRNLANEIETAFI